MKKLLTIIFSFVLASSVFATETVIEGFENSADFTVLGVGSYDRTGDSVVPSTVAGKTGNALQVVETISATSAALPWYLPFRLEKDYATPIDLSSAEYFSIDVKLPVTAQTTDKFMMGFHIQDEAGNITQMDYYPCGTATGDNFVTYNFTLTDIKKAVWHGHNAINLKKIKKIYFRIENSGTIDPGTQFTFVLDNFKMYSNVRSPLEVVIDNFDNYASMDAMTTKWVNKFASRPCDSIALVDDGNGGKAAKFTRTFTGANANSGHEITLAQPLNCNPFEYFRIRVIGDAGLTAAAPVLNVFLGDTTGSYINGLVYGWSSVGDGFADIYFHFGEDAYGNSQIDYPTDNTWTAWVSGGRIWDWKEFQYWRGTGSWNTFTNLSCINKICIATQGTAGTYPVTGSWTIDDIAFGYAVDKMPVDAQKSYNVNKVAVAPTVDGTVAAGEWAYASDPACTGFHQYDNPAVAAAEEQSVKAVFDSNNLYLLWQGKNADFKLDFDPVGKSYYNPGGTSYTGDDFEVFLAPAGNNVDHFYHMVFFPCSTNNVCYISSEIERWQAWTLSGSTAAFSYDSVNQNITIEARIPWSDFNSATSPVSGAPVDSLAWGVQLAFANNTPNEYTDWCAIEGAGGFNTRPWGNWIFKSALAVSNDSVVVTIGQTADLNITAGVAPYTWSFSSSSTVLTSAVGSLSASTGSTVTFTATAVGTAKVYCTSSDAQQKEITVTVVPTAAPLAKDWSLME